MSERPLYYILIKFNYEKYRARKYHALVDIGANLTVAKYNVLPPEMWKRKSRVIRMESAGREIHMYLTVYPIPLLSKNKTSPKILSV